MSDLLTASWTAIDLEVRGKGDGRTIAGTVVTYGVPATIFGRGSLAYEIMNKGALAKSVQERGSRIQLLAGHPNRDGTGRKPIGVATGWQETDKGMRGEFRVSDTPLGNEYLTLVGDGVIRDFSIGFHSVGHRTVEKKASDGKTIFERQSVRLDHVALVHEGAYLGAEVDELRELAALLADSPREAHLRRILEIAKAMG